MIIEKKKWMCYTYFHRNPRFQWRTAHLFSPVKKKVRGMVCVPCPTMIADIKECDFLNNWSSSTRTKINKAESDPLTLRRDKELLPDILKLFSETARHKKLRGHFPKDFESRPWILCSAVLSEDKILAGHVWLIDEEEKRSLLFVNASGHHREGEDGALIGRAHYYLLYQDGMYLRNNGIDCLDLNGYQPEINDPKLSGVYKWKEGTHGRKEELYHYYPFWFYWFAKARKKIWQ
jgi:hypothetical protein